MLWLLGSVPLQAEPTAAPDAAASESKPVQPTAWPEMPRQAGSGRSLARPGAPRGMMMDSHFRLIEDRWRLALPQWERWEFSRGLWDPYHQNVLKGDFPIIGDETFFVFTGVSDTLAERRQRFQGNGIEANEFITNQNFFASIELFHGKTVFKPKDWSVKVTGAFNLQHLDLDDTRLESDGALQEAFVELKLFDVNDYYDSVSTRVGRQFFVSDFRGFVFNDLNQGARLFGAFASNRAQWNLAVFQQQEKDPFSNFNEFDTRNQSVVIANLICQDFVWPGFFAELSFLYDRDRKGADTDLDSYTIGLAGDGHIGRLKVSPAFYYALGDQENNFVAGRDVDISAYFAALEVAYPYDWLEFRTALAYASGDSDADDGDAGGFDGIFDNPNFAGNGFSYWVREAQAIGGRVLVNGNSFYPNLRAKAAQPSNFVNPGIFIAHFRVDAKVTPKVVVIPTLNYFSFAHTDTLEKRFAVNEVDSSIGLEYGIALQYRPFLNENMIFTVATSVLHPGSGLEDLSGSDEEVYTAFVALTLVF